MNQNRKIAIVGMIAALLATGIALAQFDFERRPPRRNRGYRGERFDPNDRKGVPDWEVDPAFKSDVFTFVRVRWGGWGRRGGGWATDYPDSDLNFSFRLQQLTSLKVNPQPKVMELTDDEIFDHPFLYLIEPGDLIFTDEEVVALRRYLLNGGFLMVDDFWGEDEWDNFYHEIKRVFPAEKQEPQELPLEHPIFQCVYKLTQKPQVPSIGWVYSGRTYERWDAQTPHYKAIHDDKGRMMAIICHNTDLGDGWEREGENVDYFREFAEKWSYPMGINIVFYAMTH